MGNTANVRSWQTGEFFVAPVGTPMPTTIGGALDPAFQSLGILDEDAGAAWSTDESKNDFFGWGVGLTRTLHSKHKRSVKVVTQEDNAVVFKIENPGSVVTSAGGVTTAVVKTPNRSPFAVIATEVDGAITRLRCIDRAYITVASQDEGAEKIGMRDVTIDVVPNGAGALWTEVTNDPAMASLGLTVASIAVVPATVSLSAGTNQTQQLVVTATMSDASTMVVTTSAAYVSAAMTKAVVDTRGLVTAIATGSAVVTASYMTKTATCTVTVTA